MLRNLFILTLAFGLLAGTAYLTTAQAEPNIPPGSSCTAANPRVCDTLCSTGTITEPTCLCSYGNDNHLKLGECGELGLECLPLGLDNLCESPGVSVEAICGQNENGVVIPPTICFAVCYCDPSP